MHRFVPAHFQDPVGLARRLLGSGDADAYAAMAHAALGVVCAPVDALLEASERRLYQAAPAPVLPQLFVCGPPRSGTTLVAQALIAHLPVAWLSNLTAVFPRAPIRAMTLFSRRLPVWQATYRSYYGRSRLLNAPNDSLQIWDRWLGADRTRPRVELTAEEREAMVRFFGALEQLTRHPLVAKNNNLNLQALPVAEALPGARFLVLDREPEFLAQALLMARREIHGNLLAPYGLHPDVRADDDPITSVCRQVTAHRRAGAALHAALGPTRSMVLSYEEFCSHPQATMARIATELLGIDPATGCPMPQGLRFTVSRKRRLTADEFAAIEEGLGRLQGV